MNSLIALFLFLFSIVGGNYPENRHAIYVSVLEIEQTNETNGTIKLKVFADDLEDAIQNHTGKRLDLLHGDCTMNFSLIRQYLNEHLQLEIAGQQLAFSFVGCELNDISLWISFAYQHEASWSAISVSADYLMELFPTQSNVVSVARGETKRIVRLQKGSSKIQISL